MFKILTLMAVIGAALADPAKPELPTQYSVSNVQTVVDTNAGYPPHYTETDSNQYYDLEKQTMRYDVAEASYGNPGPYTMIKDFSQTFPVDCGRSGTFQAPRGYLIQKDKSGNDQCCYAPLIDECPPGPGEMPMPDTMVAPVLPQMAKYEGEVNSDAVAGGVTSDLWESIVMLNQSVPFMTQDYFFDASDHSTMLADKIAVFIESSGQFVNATTTFADGVSGWKLGPQDASLFDVSSYDCSAQCKSQVSGSFFSAARAQKKALRSQMPKKAEKKVKSGSCEAITDESTCMSSSEGSEKCAWCSSGAVGASCQTTSDAQALPSSVFECEYQGTKGKKDADCSQCTGNGPCAQCQACVDMKDGPCAPCWSSDNAAGEACLPACSGCYGSNSYANGLTPATPSKKDTPKLSSSAECNTYNYLKKAGFPSSSLATMVCISKYESSWNCGATNKNNDGSTDYGLMQINSYYWCSGDPTSKYDECNASCSSLMDCQKNANCAYTVYKQQGYNAWYGYKNHKSECDSYTVNC